MRPHLVLFENYDAQILTQRRTLLHLPIGTRGLGAFAAGDRMTLMHGRRASDGVMAMLMSAACTDAIIVTAERTGLLSIGPDDVEKLCAGSLDEYITSWNAKNPSEPSTRGPSVWRIEFRYAPPLPDPEWCIAA